MDMQKFYEQVDLFFAEKKAEEAENYMTEMLAQAEASHDVSAIFTICNELGGYYRAVSKYKKGIPLYEKALQIIADLGQNGSPAHGTTLINYATTCTMNGSKEKALKLYEEAVEIFSGPDYAADFNLATLYNNMSFVCQDMGDYEKGEGYLMKALDILKTLAESEVEIATTYTNLATLCAADGRLEQAKDLLQKAISLFLEETGGQDVHYAAAVSALGDVHYLEEAYADAAAQFEEALKLIERDYGTENDSYRTVAKNLQLCREKI